MFFHRVFIKVTYAATVLKTSALAVSAALILLMRPFFVLMFASCKQFSDTALSEAYHATTKLSQMKQRKAKHMYLRQALTEADNSAVIKVSCHTDLSE